ncbi:hypothetical protein RB653_005739 [Dictyostelium firmibasis]|uniref:Chitin-binding type-4 domain-containing protein n=1 Tax=Dictyostelium firmibasis TaxID=79012 RepID=A0AAN7U8I1_9MYCE
MLKYFILLIAFLSLVNGHGYSIYPPARQYVCISNPKNSIWWPVDGSGIVDEFCRDAYTYVYNRNGQSQEQAVKQFTQKNEYAVLIPDYDQGFNALKNAVPSSLCSAGANDSSLNFGDKSGMSIASSWPFTTLQCDSDNHMCKVEINYCATAVHNPSFWEIYLSENYDPTSSELTWDDLELVSDFGNILPTHTTHPGCTSSDAYVFTTSIPMRSSPATMLIRWQRDDPVGECFINCCDVNFSTSAKFLSVQK